MWAEAYLVQVIERKTTIFRDVNEIARRFAKEIVD
jgi:hypothetical protein